MKQMLRTIRRIPFRGYAAGWLALLLCSVLPAVAAGQALREDDPGVLPEGRTPLVLIHGHCGNRQTWTHEAGFAAFARITPPLSEQYKLYYFDYAAARQPGAASADACVAGDQSPARIRDLAAALAHALAANPAIGPEQDVAIVGHGTGGLIGRSFAQELAEAHRTRALITLATPHHGMLERDSAQDQEWLGCLNGQPGASTCRGGDARTRAQVFDKIVAFGLARPDSLATAQPDDGVVALASALLSDAKQQLRGRYRGLGGQEGASNCWGDAAAHVAITHADCLVEHEKGGEPTSVFEAIANALDFPPDLIVTAVAPVPLHIEPGKSFTITAIVENDGLGAATGTTMRFYASTDPTKSAGDTLLTGALGFPGLDVGQSATRTGIVTLPASLPLGTYYLIACADDMGAVVETDDDNNCLTAVGTMMVTRPDLIVENLGSPPAAAGLGGTFSITEVTKNQGLAISAASQTRFYVSPTQEKGPDAVQLAGVHAVPILTVNATHSATVTLTIPANTAFGAYFIIACADGPGAVTETDELNNCRPSTTPVAVTRPDLRVVTLTNPPVGIAPGGGFTAIDTTKNQGAVPSGASQTRYYLSTDQTKGPGDTLLTGTHAVPALAANQVHTANVAVTVPAATALGTYFLVACADDTVTVSEVTDQNNCMSSATVVTVTRPDLAAVSVSNPPSSATPGAILSVADTTKNQGTVASAASSTRYYLALNPFRSAQDRLLAGTHAVPALAANQIHTATTNVTIPANILIPFSYYLLACADDLNVVPETDNDNNCVASAQQVMVGRPDMIISQLSDPPAAVLAGEGMVVGVVVTSNVGGGPAGASRTKLYLSDDTVKSSNDRLLPEDVAVPALAPSAIYNSNPGGMLVHVPAATPLGTYYLIACADALNNVTESLEANNCLASTTTVIVTRPDLVVSDLIMPATTAPPGGVVQVTDTTLNQGLVTAQASTTRYYLSVDQVKSATDVQLTASRPVGMLPSGQDSAGSVNATIPANTPVGSYWLIACADAGSAVTELVETNNCRTSTNQVTVAP